jgi:hypothetical protein
MKLDPASLVVDSFDAGQDGLSYAAEPTVGFAERTRYCSYYETCATCYTDCPCA